jgi:S-(hydroxymethyl)glutathione dehydrogenase / alcohol dehydrogenase
VTGRVWMDTTFGGAHRRTEVLRIVAWYMDKRINIDDLITHVPPFQQINEGFEPMRKDESIRCIVY